MDSQNDNIPFLPSVLFPLNFTSLDQPAQSDCHQEILSCGQSSGVGIKCRVYFAQPGKCLPLLCMFFAASLSNFRNFGHTTRVDCNRLSVPKGHCYQQSYEQNCHMIAQGIYKNYTGRRNVNSSRTMLKLLIHGNKFGRMSTAFTKHPTTVAQNAAV